MMHAQAPFGRQLCRRRYQKVNLWPVGRSLIQIQIVIVILEKIKWIHVVEQNATTRPDDDGWIQIPVAAAATICLARQASGRRASRAR